MKNVVTVLPVNYSVGEFIIIIIFVGGVAEVN